jgi:mitochondrial fission protein ELM1
MSSNDDHSNNKTEDDLSCWVISDGRRGIENQALGLAKAASKLRKLSIDIHKLTSGRAFKAAAPLMQFAIKSNLKDYKLPSQTPDLAIGCGRQAIAPLLALKKADPGCFTVYVQDPKIECDRFDLVIAPEHDELTGRNVETMIGAPNRVTRNKIVKETLAFEERLDRLPMPRAACLIGGPSKTYQFSKADHEVHIAALRDLSSKGYSLLITTSRRTPDWVKEGYASLATELPYVWLHQEGEPNPYFAFLGGAEIILVTAESTNMLTESCSTGKPVFLLPLSGKAGKFERLHAALENHCNLKPYQGDPVAPDYTPLNETHRVAELLWAHFDKRDAVIN